MVAKAGAGPSPIPHASLEPENLASAIQFCLTPEAAAAAGEISVKMQAESGVTAAVNSFHRNLPLNRMRCSIVPNQVPVWIYKKGKEPLPLSRTAASVLIKHDRIDATHLKWYIKLSPAILNPH